jgi:hypothetical protein
VIGPGRGGEGVGIEILPGVVSIRLDRVDLSGLTTVDLRAAFDDAEAQHEEASLAPDEVLGDLDLSPL